MRVAGWGCDDSGQLSVQPPSEVIARPHFLSVPETASPTVASAGLSSSLIFSRGSSAPIAFPPASGAQEHASTSALPSITSVSSGHDFTLFVASTGALYVSGSGSFGQLAHGPDVGALPYPSLVTALAGVKVSCAAAGSRHWLACDSSGHTFACGHNASGQCGDGTTDNVYLPVCVTALWSVPTVAVSCGDNHSAVLSSAGDIFCFGSNKYGQVGQPAFTVKLCALFPMRVPLVESATGSDAKDADGDALMGESASGASSGTGGNGGVGGVVGAEEEATRRKQAGYVDVACGGMHTVAVRGDGIIVCWGCGERGQIGNRSTANSYSPVPVRPAGDNASLRFVSVSAGVQHSAAVSENGIAFLWGDGTLGQIGDGDMADKLIPVPVRTPKVPPGEGASQGQDGRFVRVFCGAYHNIAFLSYESGTEAEPTYSAAATHQSRISVLRVDAMLSATAGLPRLSSASLLEHNFAGKGRVVDGVTVDAAACVKAYASFRNLFGNEGSTVLIQAASRLRYEAQAAFGMLKGGVSRSLFFPQSATSSGIPAVSAGVVKSIITSTDQFVPEDQFGTEVAEMKETGIVLFLAFLSPIYEEKNSKRMRELSELVSLIVRTQKEARTAFIACIQLCPPELTSKCLVRPLQNLITEELQTKHRATKRTTNAVRVLDLVHRANSARLTELARIAAAASTRPLLEGEQDTSVIPEDEFYNEAVSELVNLRDDWVRWVSARSAAGQSNETAGDDSSTGQELPFSFCEFSFLLNQLAKSKILTVEAHHKMESEHHRSLMSFGMLAMPLNFSHVQSMGYLFLKVRRTHIVADSFFQLDRYAERAPNDLHKVLKVQFDGEPGEDEGGLRKEFFQVLTEEVFSPSYGMFEYHDDTKLHWFARDSPQDANDFRLVGISLGLALFNSILLDIQFPPVVYRKLHHAIQIAKGRESEPYTATLADVKEVFPAIGNSLRNLLAYEGDDVEDVFCLTYEVPYEGLYGKASAELVPGGADKPVTSGNKGEFVQLYVDYLINGSYRDAFTCFTEGILFMMSGPFVAQLSADELETLVVGERELDFEALRATTRYETYSATSSVVQNLWTVLFELDTEMRKKFLSFVCGSDRAPIGGLGNTNLIVQRSGGDSDRLPTSHTCFNVLLLPEYNTRAKLRSLLLLAIQNSTGFGLQ